MELEKSTELVGKCRPGNVIIELLDQSQFEQPEETKSKIILMGDENPTGTYLECPNQARVVSENGTWVGIGDRIALTSGLVNTMNDDNMNKNLDWFIYNGTMLLSISESYILFNYGKS